MNWVCKKSAFIVLLGLFFSFNGMCQVPQLSDQEKESIEKEISVLVATSIDDVNQRKVETFMKPYEKSDDFLYVKANGSFVGYDGLEYEVDEFFKGLKSLKFVKHDEGIRIITNTIVLYTWVGHYEAINNEGRSWVVKNYVATSLMTKIDNEWKVTYEHTSASRPIFEESN